tara:strand:- start:257 stop:703 length:447 start_codon:yes stop_codon:yes gene_type:complete
MFKKYIPTAIFCFLFSACADSILDSGNENIIENNSSIIGQWKSNDWCIYEDYTCTGNCVGGAFADFWILVEDQIDPRFTVTFSEDSTAQWEELYDDDPPWDFIFSKNLDGSYSLIVDENDIFQVKLSNSNMLLYWLEDSRCIEFTLIK